MMQCPSFHVYGLLLVSKVLFPLLRYNFPWFLFRSPLSASSFLPFHEVIGDFSALASFRTQYPNQELPKPRIFSSSLPFALPFSSSAFALSSGVLIALNLTSSAPLSLCRLFFFLCQIVFPSPVHPTQLMLIQRVKRDGRLERLIAIVLFLLAFHSRSNSSPVFNFLSNSVPVRRERNFARIIIKWQEALLR